jgi:hypothetical protein
MKINIHLQADANLDPLTADARHLELIVASRLENEAHKLRFNLSKHIRKPRMDKNGNTIGYNYKIVG